MAEATVVVVCEGGGGVGLQGWQWWWWFARMAGVDGFKEAVLTEDESRYFDYGRGDGGGVCGGGSGG